MAYTFRPAINNAIKQINPNSYSASQYTVEIRNLPKSMPCETLAIKLWSFLDEKLRMNATSCDKIVDIQIVMPNTLEYFTLKHEKINRKVFSIIK